MANVDTTRSLGLARPRIIPCLLLHDSGFVKTTRFGSPRYLGDPLNIVRLFNDKEADELVVLGISAAADGGPDLSLLSDVASECFMPLAYGGGVTTVEMIESLLELGIEKVIATSAAVRNPELISHAARRFGSQSVVAGIDAKRGWSGHYEGMIDAGQRRSGASPVELARRFADLGAGEILLQSIDRDGTRQGFDLELVAAVARTVSVPVVACGGAGSNEHLAAVIRDGGAAAAAAGSLFVYKGRHDAVLINMPSDDVIERAFVR